MKTQAPIKILFLAANPEETGFAALDVEVREIESALNTQKHRRKLQLIPKWAVRPSDLQHLLSSYEPDIVHFSGHGDPKAGKIILQADDDQGAFVVPSDHLADLFSHFKTHVRCVVLNVCNARAQAEALAEKIDTVIYMSGIVLDEAATAFATHFYDALGFGRSVHNAFEMAQDSMATRRLKGADLPQFLGDRATDFEASPPPVKKTGPVKVFCAFAEEDEEHLQELKTHLVLLRRSGRIELRHEEDSYNVSDVEDTVHRNLETAEIIVLLFSPNFLASDLYNGSALHQAMERREDSPVVIVPVILRNCKWKTTPFGKLQPLPKRGKPITTWPNRDEAWVNVAEGIESVVNRLRPSN